MSHQVHQPQLAPAGHAQFIHVESYARRAPRGKSGGNNIQKIANEAERVAGSCPHVSEPVTPRLLFGHRPTECALRSKRWAEQKLTPYLDGRTKTKKKSAGAG